MLFKIGAFAVKPSSTKERLSDLMRQRGLRQADILARAKPFCDRLGIQISRSDISQYVTGKTEPRPDKLTVLSQALGVSEPWLLGFDVDMAPSASSGEQEAPREALLSEEGLRAGALYQRASDRDKRIVDTVLEPYDDGTPLFPSREEPRPRLVTDNAMQYFRHREDDDFDEVDVFDEAAAAGLGNYLGAPVAHTEQYPPGLLPRGTSFGVLISGDSMEPRIPNGSTAFVQSRPAIDSGDIGIFVLNGQSFCKRLLVNYEKKEVRLCSFNPRYADMVITEQDELRTLGKVLGWL